MSKHSEGKEPTYAFVRARNLDTCLAKKKEMEQLIMHMETILNKKILEKNINGRDMDLSSMITTMEETLKDHAWRMCLVRQELKDQLSLPQEVEDWELVMAVDMSAKADEYASVEEMISDVGVEATVHALEKGWDRMSEQLNVSNITTAGEYRALRDFEGSALKEECNCM